jgi:hypothetical protein
LKDSLATQVIADCTPTCVLPGESVQARQLAWMPLAVRFKLDRCGLRIGLAQWQAMSLTERSALLVTPEGQPFEQLLAELCTPSQVGSTTAATRPRHFLQYVHRKLWNARVDSPGDVPPSSA